MCQGRPGHLIMHGRCAARPRVRLERQSQLGGPMHANSITAPSPAHATSATTAAPASLPAERGAMPWTVPTARHRSRHRASRRRAVAHRDPDSGPQSPTPTPAWSTPLLRRSADTGTSEGDGMP